MHFKSSDVSGLQKLEEQLTHIPVYFSSSLHGAGDYTTHLQPPPVFYYLTPRNWGNIWTLTGKNWKVKPVHSRFVGYLAHWGRKVKGKVVGEVTDTLNTAKYFSFRFLDIPRFPENRPFCWKVSRLFLFIVLLRVALKVKKGVEHWWNATDRKRSKYSE